MHFLDSLWFLFGGIGFGIATAIVAAMIDFAFDYGHLLGSVRYNKASFICMKLNMPQLWKKFTDDMNKITDFTERLEYADDFYWKIAGIYNPFAVWLCKICIGFRINFVLAMALLCAGAYIGEPILYLLNMLIASILSNFFFLKKVI